MIAEGDKVMVKIKMIGTHEVEYQGIPATNTRITMYASSVITLIDGKVKDWWAIEDYFEL